jgi:hypothetical protein
MKGLEWDRRARLEVQVPFVPSIMSFVIHSADLQQGSMKTMRRPSVYTSANVNGDHRE